MYECVLVLYPSSVWECVSHVSHTAKSSMSALLDDHLGTEWSYSFPPHPLYVYSCFSGFSRSSQLWFHVHAGFLQQPLLTRHGLVCISNTMLSRWSIWHSRVVCACLRLEGIRVTSKRFWHCCNNCLSVFSWSIRHDVWWWWFRM